jgi:hypothetical protein
MPGDVLALDESPLIQGVDTAEQARRLRAVAPVLTVIDGRITHAGL